MNTEPVQTYRGVLIYENTERDKDGFVRRSHHCSVNGDRIDSNTLEAMKRRIDSKLR